MRFKEFYNKDKENDLLESCSKKLVFNQDEVLILERKFKETSLDRLKKKYGITELEKRTQESNAYSMGFSPKNNKWYGWSHRAIAGFTIGSKCEMGDCHFKPSNKEEFFESIKKYYSDDMYKNVNFIHNRNGIRITYEIHRKNGDTITNSILEKFPNKWGKGKWTAKTMEDAKQMAYDFAESVS